MDKFKEVKTILDRYFVAGVLTRRNAAVEICQLFQEPEFSPAKSDDGLIKEIAEIIRYADTKENPVLIPEYLKVDYIKAARKILALISAHNKDKREVKGWLETVLSTEEARNYTKENMPELINRTISTEYYPERWHRERQAEISYKAGYEAGYKQRRLEENPLVQQGMQKVVEFTRHKCLTWNDPDSRQFLKDNNLEGKER